MFECREPEIDIGSKRKKGGKRTYNLEAESLNLVSKCLSWGEQVNILKKGILQIAIDIAKKTVFHVVTLCPHYDRQHPENTLHRLSLMI